MSDWLKYAALELGNLEHTEACCAACRNEYDGAVRNESMHRGIAHSAYL